MDQYLVIFNQHRPVVAVDFECIRKKKHVVLPHRSLCCIVRGVTDRSFIMLEVKGFHPARARRESLKIKLSLPRGTNKYGVCATAFLLFGVSL